MAFDTNTYLANKTAQLNAIGQGGKKDWTVESTKAAIEAAGMDPETHYQRHGVSEGLTATASKPAQPVSKAVPVGTTPTPSWFDVNKYLTNKTAQLNSIKQGGRSDWTDAQTIAAIQEAGMTPYEHYQRHGYGEGVKYYDNTEIPLPETTPASGGGGGGGKNFLGMIDSINRPINLARVITPNETVAGQLNSLLSSDSAYMQNARANGMATANDRGLINSSLAGQASQKAAIEAGAPIAGQDASTYAASGLSAQNANQELNAAKYSAQLKTVTDAQALYNNATLQEQQGKITSELQAQKDAATAKLNTMLKEMDVRIDIEQIASGDRNAYVNAVSPVIQQYQVQYAAIQNTPNEVMNAATKATAIGELDAMYRSQIVSLSNIYGYTVNWGEVAAGN